MPPSILLAFSFLAITLATGAPGATFAGLVRRVPNGQSLQVRDDSGRQHTVRLHAISAPTEGQPYSDASSKKLAGLVLNKKVWVDWFQKKKGAEVGRVFLNGDDLAVKLLRSGAVWYDHRQAGDQSVADRGIYKDAQDAARSKSLGLWRDAHAIEPWKWRNASRRAAASTGVK